MTRLILVDVRDSERIGPFAELAQELEFGQPLRRELAGGGQDAEGDGQIEASALLGQIGRITSYNVCYTKLLRQGLRAGFQRGAAARPGHQEIMCRP